MPIGAKILAIDDEPGMRAGIERALRHFVVHVPSVEEDVSFEVDTAGTGEEGLEKIESMQPDLLLLDHKLPGISGLDVLEKLHDHEQERDMLTIMITAYASLDTAVKATKRGAYDFLAKPFTPVELKSSIRKATKHLVLRRKAQALAEERRQVRFQFLSVLTHELKAPLGAVEGFLQVVHDRTAGDDPKVYEQLIERSLVRLRGMQKLIYDLLDLTRIEAGTKKRELADVDVCDVAHSAVELVSQDAASRDISIEIVEPDSLVMRADRGELEIVLNNLVSNAVKYNRDGGNVTVRLDGDDEKVVIEVRDTGIGMSPADTSRLFSDFVRIKNAKTRGILGSGLGLSTAKKIAELYHGSITVDSEVDVGSTFRVELQRDTTPDDELGDESPKTVPVESTSDE